MLSARAAGALLLAALPALSQIACPELNFLSTRTLNLKPSPTTHTDVLRQSDGSYTGYEVIDAAPYRLISVSKNLERALASCLPHTLPTRPSFASWSPLGSPAQLEAAASLPSGRTVLAQILASQSTLITDTFDPQHDFLSETTFSYATPAGSGNRSDLFIAVALDDLNHDGTPDLIAAFATNRINGLIQGGVWVFLGNPDGSFQSGQRYVLKTNMELTAALSLTVGDQNGDGIPDILLSAYHDQGGLLVDLIVAPGNGDGTLGPPISLIPAGLNIAPNTSFALADLNHDGLPDIVAGLNGYGSTAYITVMLAGASTTQTYPVQPLAFIPGSPSIAPIAIADLNGDGIPDIATASGSVLFGDGKGSFPNRADYSIDTAASVLISDFDGDGIPDLIFANGNPGFFSAPHLTVLFGTGIGTFAGAPVSAVALGPVAYGLAIADFNRDGIPDAAIVSWVANQTFVNILKGVGDATFRQIGPAITLPVTGGPPASVVAADFNHDGIPDLAIVTAGASSEQLLLLPGKGDGTFSAGPTYTLPDSNTSFLAAPDVNGDGIPDLIAVGANATSVFLSKGDGTFFANPYQIQAASPAFAFGDFNGDGRLDIALISRYDTTVYVYPGKGDGTFGAPITTPLPVPAFGSPGNIAAADFDGDGNLDLAFTATSGVPTACEPIGCNEAVGNVVLLSGNGAGGFVIKHSSLIAATNLIAADINGDKIPDLMENGSSGLSACLGNGDGTFQPCAAIGSAADFYAVTDLNRDGTPDIAALSGPGLAAYLNLSQASSPLTVVSAASFAAGPLAPGAIASAFGEKLGVSTVSVSDASLTARPAFVYFTSSSQVNFIVPPSTIPGPATVILNGTLRVPIQVQPIAPALFAGAYYQLPEPGQTYLVIFGTGFDAATAAETTARVQGIAVPVTYAGVQPSFAGLDQINIALPASLLGTTGNAAVSVTVAGVTSNILYVTIR